MSDPWGEVDEAPGEEVKVGDADPWGQGGNEDEGDWTKTNYDSTAPRGERRPRGGRRGDRRPRGPRRDGGNGEREGDSSRSSRGDSHRADREDSYRGGSYRGDRGDGRGRGRGDRMRSRFSRGFRGPSDSGRPRQQVAERTKIKRHRLFENNHNQEVIYREDEQTIDPEMLSTQSHFRANKNWEELNIPENLLGAIEEIGYIYPSKIQSFGIEVILAEGFENLIAQAPNGSGKTATFIIGSLCRLDLNDPTTQVICISHTIELTNQIFEEYSKITSKIGAKVSLISKDFKAAELGQVVVTVAGSFLKALRAKSIDLSHLKVFVVDEADHLFDSKTSPEFYNGLNHAITSSVLPKNVQYLLFSATFNDAVKTDIVRLLKEMNEITIKKEELMLDLIKHYYIRCEQSQKITEFEKILKRITRGITISFINTCNFAMTVCRRITQLGNKAALLMGRDMSIDERNLTMKDFRDGKYGVLVTTNLLARGIDNTKVTCVVNFDLPRVIKTKEMDYVLYLHRSGRCSRFGRHGFCFNLIANDEELSELKTIEEYFNIEINELGNIEEITKMLEDQYGPAEEV